MSQCHQLKEMPTMPDVSFADLIDESTRSDGVAAIDSPVKPANDKGYKNCCRLALPSRAL